MSEISTAIFIIGEEKLWVKQGQVWKPPKKAFLSLDREEGHLVPLPSQEWAKKPTNSHWKEIISILAVNKLPCSHHPSLLSSKSSFFVGKHRNPYRLEMIWRWRNQKHSTPSWSSAVAKQLVSPWPLQWIYQWTPNLISLLARGCSQRNYTQSNFVDRYILSQLFRKLYYIHIVH